MLSLLALAATGSFCDASGFVSIFKEDFNSLDETIWTKDVGPPGDSKTRAANATADSVWVQDGSLVIRSSADWNGTNWTNLNGNSPT